MNPIEMLLATFAMGTRFELVLPGEEDQRVRAIGEEALREIEHWHTRLSRFHADSDIARLNRNPLARAGAEVADLLGLCDGLRAASEGAFDHRTGPGGSIDLGAIAKGFALDRAACLLREHGVDHAFLHGGTSSIIALGAPGEAAGWSITVRSDGEPLTLILRDQAVGVSAPRGRVHPDGSTHILDPRTGLPAGAADTTAVVGSIFEPFAAAACDAWSTALVVLGERPACMSDTLASHIHTASGWRSTQPAPRLST